MASVVVLIVDDEPAIIALLTDLLEGEGYHVVGACDGREAFRIATEMLPAMVLTDINMPWLNGIELCGMLHTDIRTRRIPVILMSAASPPRPRETDAAAFIAKPFDCAHVVEVIAAMPPRNRAHLHPRDTARLRLLSG